MTPWAWRRPRVVSAIGYDVTVYALAFTIPVIEGSAYLSLRQLLFVPRME
jgi:hypothetical protein